MKMLHCDIVRVIHVQCLVHMVMVTARLAVYCQMLYLSDLLCHCHRAKHCR